ncbi:hypothetical protein H8356DRAFT_1324200 [Neocallimastix lanati (nom. inval.)]|nr:hypothetical protein H8356DRAFT_1324200 [Neocallimastix sp. JGI-2020a]
MESRRLTSYAIRRQTKEEVNNMRNILDHSPLNIDREFYLYASNSMIKMVKADTIVNNIGVYFEAIKSDKLNKRSTMNSDKTKKDNATTKDDETKKEISSALSNGTSVSYSKDN